MHFPSLKIHVNIYVAGFCLILALFSVGCARGRHEVSPYPPSRSEETPSIWPINHPATRISSVFGEARSGGRRHKGIDLAAPEGTLVVATASGETTFSGWQGTYGNIIIVNHGNGLETAYAHLKRCLRSAGEYVCRGEKIGLVGATGNATGPHLHYEVRQDGVSVNPIPWLP